MQKITTIAYTVFFRTGLMTCVLLTVMCSRAIAQVQCRDSLTSIIQSYNGGQWQLTREAALRYVNGVKIGKNGFSDSSGIAQDNNLSNCTAFLPQAYYYLIKSCIRLYDLESAQNYYKQALLNELVINLDTADSNTKQYFSFKRVQFSIGALAAITTTSNKTHFAYKFGLQYGIRHNFKLEAYGELSFSQRYFKHVSSQKVGAFGKSLPYNAREFPNYNFTISGRERFMDLLYYAKFPINLPIVKNTADNIKSYLCTGVFITYYLGSSVQQYDISQNKSFTDTTRYTANTYSTRVPGLDMDLKNMYANRFSFGFAYGFGYKFTLSKSWLMFAELRYSIGTNFRYKFDTFNNYKVGLSYLSFMVGLTKRTNKLKELKASN